MCYNCYSSNTLRRNIWCKRKKSILKNKHISDKYFASNITLFFHLILLYSIQFHFLWSLTYLVTYLLPESRLAPAPPPSPSALIEVAVAVLFCSPSLSWRISCNNNKMASFPHIVFLVFFKYSLNPSISYNIKNITTYYIYSIIIEYYADDWHDETIMQ